MKIIECPRDAIQGLKKFVPTETKILYINALLKVGFHTLDCGSFVSPKIIPQMKDTGKILPHLNIKASSSRILVIVANLRGATEAIHYDEVSYLGFPLSLSETFQKRNTNLSINQALQIVEEIQDLCVRFNKKIVIYLSMGFGNPYGENYDCEMIGQFIEKLDKLDIKIISLADTIGSSTPDLIDYLFKNLILVYPNIELGTHFHSHPLESEKKIQAAIIAGCKRIDGAIGGMGGCPMAKDDLVGNISTEKLIAVSQKNGIDLNIDIEEFKKACLLKKEIFG